MDHCSGARFFNITGFEFEDPGLARPWFGSCFDSIAVSLASGVVDMAYEASICKCQARLSVGPE